VQLLLLLSYVFHGKWIIQLLHKFWLMKIYSMSILDECHFTSVVTISRIHLVIDQFCILLMQIVSYEEDLSGRQMLIDRVLTRSSMQWNPTFLEGRWVKYFPDLMVWW
jgi:hypothetical protein